MKIIGTDNLARETVADILVAESVVSGPVAEEMCRLMNANGGGTYYRVVDDSYVLSRGTEDLV
jgi:hypothetical protein